MIQIDSFEKIVKYFSVVTKQSFTFRKITYNPKPLNVSVLLFRDATCPPNCGGCCPRFSLDYLPKEDYPEHTEIREIEFNGKIYLLRSDLQKDNKRHFCRHLNKEGRCNIYSVRPFTCEFELIRTLVFSTKPNIILTRLYGRGWNMLRIDGERGALCTITPITEASFNNSIGKLKRLQMWSDYFEIETKIPDVLNWAESVRDSVLNRQPIKSIQL